MNLPNRRLAKKRIKSVISKQRFTDLHDFLALGNILLARLTNIFLARRETVAQRVFVIFAREGTLEHLSYILQYAAAPEFWRRYDVSKF